MDAIAKIAAAEGLQVLGWRAVPVYDTMIGVFGDGSAMMLALVVFLAAAVMALGAVQFSRH